MGSDSHVVIVCNESDKKIERKAGDDTSILRSAAQFSSPDAPVDPLRLSFRIAASAKRVDVLHLGSISAHGKHMHGWAASVNMAIICMVGFS
jgi:hypothetical protein